jgi:hypothetical protein
MSDNQIAATFLAGAAGLYAVAAWAVSVIATALL